MSKTARVWSPDNPLSVSPVTRDIQPYVPTSSAMFDIRTDATLDADISLTFAATPVVSSSVSSGLPFPTYSGTILVAAMNHIVELKFDTPVKIIKWTASSPTGKLLLLEMFDIRQGTDNVAR